MSFEGTRGDPVEKIPARSHGDETVHGTTFDSADAAEMNFPIRAGGARAAGSTTHGYRVVQDDPPVVILGRQPLSQVDPVTVVLVCFSRTRGRPLLRKLSVARWRWRDVTILRPTDVTRAWSRGLELDVLRLSFDIEVDLRERDEVERILGDLAGNDAKQERAGVLDAHFARHPYPNRVGHGRVPRRTCRLRSTACRRSQCGAARAHSALTSSRH